METVKKKQCVRTKIIDDHFDMIFDFVGYLTQCKAVSKNFMSLSCIKHVRFSPEVNVNVLFAVVSKRYQLKTIDLTECSVVNNSIIHVLIEMFPTLELLVLDNCDFLTMFPTRSLNVENPFIYLKSNGIMKWGEDVLPRVSMKGCWRLYKSYYRIDPENMTSIIIRAIQNGSYEAMQKVRSFCFVTDDENWTSCFSKKNMLVSLRCHKSWQFIKQEERESMAYVLIRVDNYSLLVWLYTKEYRRHKYVWNLLVVWTIDIRKMWLMCKRYVSM